MIKYDPKAIKILRKRQNDLFKNYIIDDSGREHPSKAISSSCITTKVCPKCNKNHPVKDFAFNVRTGESRICRKCDKYYKNSDVFAYRAILRNIRRDERKRNSISSTAFIMQDDDVKTIIDHIWHRHSILSQENDLKVLR